MPLVKSNAAMSSFAIAIICLLLTAFFARIYFIGLAFGIAAIYFAAMGVRSLRRDPYDLKLLKEIEEKEELREIEREIDEYELFNQEEALYCSYCDEVFDARLSRCPSCGRIFR